jgi:hypothetical protein
MSENLSNELKQKTSSESWGQGRRVRMEISMTAKGLAQPSITLEMLNQEFVTVKNPNDLGDNHNEGDVEFLKNKLVQIKKELKEVGIQTTY